MNWREGSLFPEKYSHFADWAVPIGVRGLWASRGWVALRLQVLHTHARTHHYLLHTRKCIGVGETSGKMRTNRAIESKIRKNEQPRINPARQSRNHRLDSDESRETRKPERRKHE